MKKITALFVVMLFTAAASADSIIPRVSIDFPGQIKTSGGNVTGLDTDTETGFGLGADYYHPIGDVFAIGAGFEYLFDRKVKNTSSQFGFMPVYVTGMLAPFKTDTAGQEGWMKSFAPYAKVNLGYNVMYTGNDNYKFLNSSLIGGFYWAAGIGAKLPYNLTADIMYSSYAGQHEIKVPLVGTAKTDDTYTKVSVNVGYAFDLGMGSNTDR